MDFESQQQEYLQQQGYRYYQHQQLVKQQYQSQAPTRPTEEIPGPSYPLSSSYSTFSNHISSYNSSQTTTQSPLRCCTFGIGEGPIRNSIFLCNLPIFGQTPLHIHYFWPFLILILAISVASTSISFLYFFYAFLMSCPILFGTYVHQTVLT